MLTGAPESVLERNDMSWLCRFGQWGLLAVVFAVGCGDATSSQAGSSRGGVSGGSGDASTGGPSGQGGSATGHVGGDAVSEGGTASGGAGGEPVRADGGGAGVAGAEQGPAGGEGDAGAGGVPFGCMPNPAACPDEQPESMATCAQSTADAGTFCAYGSCSQACVCNGMQMGSEASFAWLCFPIGD